MIEVMTNNDVLEASILTKKTWDSDEFHGYGLNEAAWISHCIKIITNQEDPNFLAIKDVDDEGVMRGFMLCSTFVEHLSNKVVMDVKDCIVDYSRGKIQNTKTTLTLFDYMIEHTKSHGGTNWRADSVHSHEEAMAFARLLNKRYGSAIHTSARGVIE